MNPRTPTINTREPRPRRRSIGAAFAIAAGLATLAACGGASSSSNATTTPPDATAAPAGDQVLPVTANPISNPSAEQLLTIDSVLVENNVDPETGKDADDHLEIAVTNSGTAELTGFEVFYTYDDKVAGVTESYYAALPAGFTVAPGASRVIHFDNSGAPDHFGDNQYSLYHTSLNPMDVTVEVSATNAAPQTMTVKKDKGGDEVAD
jgi:hypothetical protein